MPNNVDNPEVFHKEAVRAKQRIWEVVEPLREVTDKREGKKE